MGSSDPLPAGFEIQFGSLNFQATGNGYLIRITNRVKLHPWWSTGPGPVPVTPAADARRPLRRTLWALRRPDADGARASARTKRRWNDVRPRMSPLRNAPTSETAAAPTEERVAPEPRFPHKMRNTATAYASSASAYVAAYEQGRSHRGARRGLPPLTLLFSLRLHP
jgi:hypothetical protein